MAGLWSAINCKRLQFYVNSGSRNTKSRKEFGHSLIMSTYLGIDLDVVATFSAYAMYAVIGFAFVLWPVAETRAKTLEELEQEWMGRSAR